MHSSGLNDRDGLFLALSITVKAGPDGHFFYIDKISSECASYFKKEKILISPQLKNTYLKRRNITAGVAIAVMIFFIVRKIAGEDVQDHWYISVLMFLYLFSYSAACWFYLKSKQRSSIWLLLIPANIVGLLIYMCLEDRSEKPDNIPCPVCSAANFPNDLNCRLCKTLLHNPIPG